jgi:hypothetical protein
MQFAQRSGVGVGRKFSSLCCAYSIWEAVLQRQRLDSSGRVSKKPSNKSRPYSVFHVPQSQFAVGLGE